MNDLAFRLHGYYQTPLDIPGEVLEHLRKQCESQEDYLMPSLILGGEDGRIDESIRKSKNCWLPTDHWISCILSSCILDANKNFFQFKLSAWSEKIQYIVYGEEGSKYNWHVDSMVSPYNESIIRKLSISVLLSDPDEYEGGELQLLQPETMTSLRPAKGTAIIFPSSTRHRVRPVKSGVRRSLVGWYGGPAWE